MNFERLPEMINGPVFNMNIIITYRPEDGRIGDYYMVAHRPFQNDRRGSYFVELWEKKYTLQNKPTDAMLKETVFVGNLRECNIVFNDIFEKLLEEFNNERSSDR